MKSKDLAIDVNRNPLVFEELATSLASLASYCIEGDMDMDRPIEEFKHYLENLFYDKEDGTKMSWKNYGYYGWHLDHIRPLSSFDLTDREQFLEACHYTNLQPMWGIENIRKNDATLPHQL